MFTFRWATWSRDVLLVASGMIISAAVMLPLGWLELQAARQRAQSAEHDASGHETKLKEIEKNRAEEREAKQWMESQAKAVLP